MKSITPAEISTGDTLYNHTSKELVTVEPYRTWVYGSLYEINVAPVNMIDNPYAVNVDELRKFSLVVHINID